MFDQAIFYDITDVGLVQRQLNAIHRQAGQAAMGWYVRERLAKRFDGSMSAQLGFEARDDWYRQLKARKRGGAPDHRWSGRSLAASRRAVVRVTRKRLTAQVRGLAPGYGRFKSATKPDLLGELRRIGRDEMETIARKYAEAYRNGMVEAMRKGRSKRRRGEVG